MWFNGSHGDVVNSKGFVRSKSGCLNLKSNRSKYGCLISVIRLIVFLSPLKQIDLSISDLSISKGYFSSVIKM